MFYSRCQLYFFLVFLPQIFSKLHSSIAREYPVYTSKFVVDGRLTADGGWKNNENSNTEYGKRGHSFGSRTELEPRSEWGRSAHTDLFRPSRSYPSKSKDFDKGPPISYRPIVSNIKQSSSYANHNLRSQVSCNVVIRNTLFYLQSPYYPLQYPSNSHCLYTIKRALGACSIQLDIRNFYLEPIADCSRDWLLVGDRKYCGLHRPRKLIVPLSEIKDLTIEFRSDYQYQFQGFYIAGQQLPCPPTPPKTLVVKNPFRPPLSLLVPPTYSYPPRPPNEHLLPTYLVKQQPKIPPSLIIPLQKYPSQYPTLKPHPSTYTPRPSVIPSKVPPTFTPPHYTTVIPPPSASCDLTFNTSQGQFQSLNYPENYGPNLSCDLRFVPPSSYCILELFFQDFQLEDSKGCKKDALIIGGNRYCSTSLTDQRLRITFVSGSSISLKFVTDSDGNARGYKATYRMLTCEDFSTTLPPYTTPPGVTCDRVLGERESFITSVNYPLPYLKNLDCIYSIPKWSPIVDELEISFLAFDLQDSTDCRNDYLEISGERYCGVQTGLTLRVPFVSSYQFEIRFHSDTFVQNTGFNIRILQLDKQVTTAPPPTTPPASSYCKNEIFIESNFLMISPQFPLLYLPGQVCRYSVMRTSQEVCELQFKFTFFSLPGVSDDDCEGDYLQIENNKFCGDMTGQTKKIPFYGQQMNITFISDLLDDQAQGYSVQVVQLTDCTSPYSEIKQPLIRVEDSLIRRIPLIPGYEVTSADIKVQNNHECGYIINQEEDACGVEIHFKEFYIHPSVNCSENYFEVDNRHFCGQQLDNMRIDVRFPMDGRPIYLPLRIAHQSKFSWTLNTSLISCSNNLHKECSPTVWSSEGIFQYSASPNFERTQCDFVIRKWSRRICRLQLDFINFNISDRYNNCETSFLDVDGNKICGNMTGRKMSIEFSSSEDMAVLKIDHVDDVDLKMRVQQIQCR